MTPLAFALSVSSMVYQRITNRITVAYLYRFCRCYIDDVISYSRLFSDHLIHLLLILTRLSDAGLRLRADKCLCAQHKLPYLLFVLSAESDQPDPNKLTIIKYAKRPKKVFSELLLFIDVLYVNMLS